MLQKRLNEIYAGVSGYEKLKEDGYFGAKTLAAVNMYKEEHGLWNFGEYEGKVGETTWNHMFSLKIEGKDGQHGTNTTGDQANNSVPVSSTGTGGNFGGYADFLDKLGNRESSGNYGVVNQYNFLGKYQMGEYALEDAGFYYDTKDTSGAIHVNGDNKYEGAWTALAQQYGVTSMDTFLNNANAQEFAIKEYHKKTWQYLKNYGLDQYIGQTIHGVKTTASGLLALGHLLGPSGARQYFTGEGPMRENADGVPIDGNNTPGTEYMKLMGGCDISSLLGYNPDINNTTSSANGSFVRPIVSGREAGYVGDSGLDIAVPKGTPCVAAISGTIVYSEWGHTKWRPDIICPDGKYHPDDTPYSVLIKLDNPITFEGRTAYYIWYTHLSSIKYNVSQGDGQNIRVNAGEHIGDSGLGRSNPHLHFGMIINQAQKGPDDYFSMEQVRRFLNLQPGQTF
jgi:murein DD-endopeptidase MepM/ murein hydrolase activator NlpD